MRVSGETERKLVSPASPRACINCMWNNPRGDNSNMASAKFLFCFAARLRACRVMIGSTHPYLLFMCHLNPTPPRTTTSVANSLPLVGLMPWPLVRTSHQAYLKDNGMRLGQLFERMVAWAKSALEEDLIQRPGKGRHVVDHVVLIPAERSWMHFCTG